MKTADEKIKEIVDLYSCYDTYCIEQCNGKDDEERCKKNLEKDLQELVEIVKNTKTERKGTVEELTSIFENLLDTYDDEVIEEAYHKARLWEYD